MISPPPTPDRCKALLSQWRRQLILTNLEEAQLAGELKYLDRQLERLMTNQLKIAVFGRVGVGKSSLLNALLNEDFFATDVAHGCTRCTKTVIWNESIDNLKRVELVDTPGIDEIAAAGRSRLATRVSLQADLILLVLDSDLTSVELEALKSLLIRGKPILVVLNRSDQWTSNEQMEIVKSISKRLPPEALKLKVQVVAAAPRQVRLKAEGRVRSHACKPRVEPLRKTLKTLLQHQGELLLALNALRQADHFSQVLSKGRLKRSKQAAQGLIGRFAALKASGVAANPLCLLDLAGGFAFDTALVLQLSKLYGLQMGGKAARQLLKRLSLHNVLLGGTQIGIQFALATLRQLLVIATPISNGLSLAPAGPVALAQAALAVHTTKLTGRLAAQELLRSSQRQGAQPRALLRRLIATDPQVQRWLSEWPSASTNESGHLQTLLP